MVLVVKHTIQKPSGLWFYRRYWPLDVRSQFPTTRFIRSLGHRDSKGFMTRYERCGNDYDEQVAMARRKLAGDFDTLDEPLIAYLAAAFRSHVLAREEELLWDPEGHEIHHKLAEELRAAGFKQLGPWERPGEILANQARQALAAGLPTFRRLKATGDIVSIVDQWGTFAIEFAESLDRLLDLRNTEGMRNLCRALNDAALAAGDGALRRLDGEDVPTPPEPVAPPRKTPENPTAARVPLLATYNTYAERKGIREAGRRESRAYLQALIDFLGHDDAAKISFEDLRRWRDALLAEKTKRGTLRDPVTVRSKYLSTVKATLQYAKTERLLPTNVAQDLVVLSAPKPKLRERSFTDDEARAVLKAALGPHSPSLNAYQARARRWVPWLCAYTGARVNELTQLRKEDVFEEDGIWAIRITPEAGGVKNNEAREVPLHPHLIEQGFVELVDKLKPGPIFYDPTRQRTKGAGNRYRKKAGERLRDWVRNEVGITDPNVQPNHGWRHTFKELSYGAMEERMADGVQGHSSGSVGRRYGARGGRLTAKAEAIARIPRFCIPGA